METALIKVNYKTVEGVNDDLRFGNLKTYAIRGEDCLNGETLEIPKVSYDKNFAERLTFILNENQVSLLHADDVVRDLISEIFVQR